MSLPQNDLAAGLDGDSGSGGVGGPQGYASKFGKDLI
jgi:hypothetical protein